MNASEAESLIALIEALVWERNDLRAMAVCGSWARGNPRADSDLDILIITQDPTPLRRSQKWIQEIQFYEAGFEYIDHEIAEYGAVWSAHIELKPGAELELTVAEENWASVDAMDMGTRSVITDAFKIIVDKDGALHRAVNACL
jgi:predicted nucleotidyltransferase